MMGIVDAAVRAGCCDKCTFPECGCKEHHEGTLLSLRAAFPREPSAETVEAMAAVARDNTHAAYRALPLWQELYGDEE